MKLEIQYYKDEGILQAKISVIDNEGYYTDKIFERKYDDGEIYDYKYWIIKGFELSDEGLKKAQEWVQETIENVKKKVQHWRNFKLPEPETIEF